jgi:CBS domain-containing protein
MKKHIIPDVIAKPQELVLVSGETTVRDAVQLMASRRIGAVMIGEGQTLFGIFTERDLMTKWSPRGAIRTR